MKRKTVGAKAVAGSPTKRGKTSSNDGEKEVPEIEKEKGEGNTTKDVNEGNEIGKLDDTIEQKVNEVAQLFVEVDGYEVSRQEKIKLKEKARHMSLTYGEINLAAFAEVLKIVAPVPGEKFYDIGSGTGRAVLLAAQLYPHTLTKCCGIEIVSGLHQVALEMKAKYMKLVDESGPQIDFLEGDSFAIDWEKEADIVFAPTTCWPPELLEQLKEKTSRMKLGSRVITQTVPLKVEGLQQIHKQRYKYGATHGSTLVYIYKKVS